VTSSPFIKGLLKKSIFPSLVPPPVPQDFLLQHGFDAGSYEFVFRKMGNDGRKTAIFV